VETHFIGAQGEEYALTVWQRLLLAPRILWFYLGKLLWPAKLTFFYPRWDVPAEAVSWIPFLLAALAVTVALWLLRRRSRGPLAAWLLYAGTLFPALGFFNVYPFAFSYVADHFQYLASLAPIALFAAGAARAAAAGPAAPVAAGLLLAALAAASFAQTRIYRDQETLWRHVEAENPDSWLAQEALGVFAERAGRIDEAIARFRRSLSIEPRQHEGHHKLGNALRLRGDLDGALAQLERALAIAPRSVAAWNHLGLTQHDRGDFAAAADAYERALAIHPDFAAAHTNLGITLQAQGDLAGAESRHREALRIAPDLAAAHTNLASVLLLQGEVREAVAHLERVAELLPESELARQNLRAARRQLRRSERDLLQPSGRTDNLFETRGPMSP